MKPLVAGQHGVTGVPDKMIDTSTVTPCVSDIFRNDVLCCSHRKGVALQPAEVRSIVTEYVKKNDLVDETNKK